MKTLSSEKKKLFILKAINLISLQSMSSIARTVSFNWKSEIVRKLQLFTLSYFQNINEEWTSLRSQLCIFTRCSEKKLNHDINRGIEYFFSNLKSKYINKQQNRSIKLCCRFVFRTCSNRKSFYII